MRRVKYLIINVCDGATAVSIPQGGWVGGISSKLRLQTTS
jgi:hypothetical protein